MSLESYDTLNHEKISKEWKTLDKIALLQSKAILSKWEINKLFEDDNVANEYIWTYREVDENQIREYAPKRL